MVRDIKIIEGVRGPFVAMPSRKLTERCTRCGTKNHLRSKFCNECGSRVVANRVREELRGRSRLHTDIAHPINARCRAFIETSILEAFYAEVERSKSPGYVSPDIDDFDYDEDIPEIEAEAPRVQPSELKIDHGGAH